MSILYSAGDRVGANSQMARLLAHLDKRHIVKIAAYIRSSDSISHIDWTLDSLNYNKPPHTDDSISNLFGYKGVPFVNIDNTKVFLKEAENFEPDLIISDGEPIAGHIARKIGAPLWYCSPIHLLDGIEWEKGQLRYTDKLSKLRRFLKYFTEPDLHLVYSPFGDIKFRPYLREGYEWITPFHYDENGEATYFPTTTGIAIVNDTERFADLSKILNGVSFNLKLFSPFNEKYSNIDTAQISDKKKYSESIAFAKWLFTTGETSYLADAFYNFKDICIAPTLTDYEGILNAILCRCYNIGVDVSQVELQGSFALDSIEKSFSKRFKKDYLSKQRRLLLHERIEQLCST